MKQLRWIWALGIAAVLLTVIFIIVDQRSKAKEKKAAEIGPQQLISVDSNDVTRLSVENTEGNYVFDWDTAERRWKLTEGGRFQINTYAVDAICNYICDLSSVKTVAEDCDDISVYGLEHPTVLKVYTAQTGNEHPYVLYLGDATPTKNGYYVMMEGSGDVYTIAYMPGQIFSINKDALRNTYLFDFTTSTFYGYKLERNGKIVIDMSRGDDLVWEIHEPEGFGINLVGINDLVDNVIRVELSSFVESDPDDLAKYGLDHPQAKLWLEARDGDKPVYEEIWFGANTTEGDDADEIYGYFAQTEQVFTIQRSKLKFLDEKADAYVYPACIDIGIDQVKSAEIDMGEIYDMHEVLRTDYENDQYWLGDTDITALNDSNVTELYRAYFRAISNLAFTELELDAKPDLDAEPVMQIIYTYLDGKKTTLNFIEKEENCYYLIRDGKYTGMAVRLNCFTGKGCVTDAYEALMDALK